MKALVLAGIGILLLSGCADLNTKDHSYKKIDCDALVHLYSNGQITGDGNTEYLKRRVVAVSEHFGKKSYRVRDVNIHGMVSEESITILQCRS